MSALSIREWLDYRLMGAPLVPGPTDRLALVLNNHWDRDSYFVDFTCYMDESGTHGGDGKNNPASPFMVLSGYVASLGKWHHFDRKWKKHLDRHHLDHLHFKKFQGNRHRKENPGFWTDDKEDRFLAKAAKLVQQHVLFGLTVRLSTEDYKTHYCIENKPNKIHLDTPYGLCFRVAAVSLPDLIKQKTGQETFTLNFVLEDGDNRIGDAQRVFRELRDSKMAGFSELFGSCVPEPKKKFGGLQLADFAASHTWQEGKSQQLPIPRGPGYDTEKVFREEKSPLFHMVLDGNMLPNIRSDILGWYENRMAFGRAQDRLIKGLS